MWIILVSVHVSSKRWCTTHWKVFLLVWEKVIIFKQRLSSKQSHPESSKPTSKTTRKERIIIEWTESSASSFWRRTLFILISSKESTEKIIFKRILFEKVSKNIFSIVEIECMASKSWSRLRSGPLMTIFIVSFPFIFIRKYFISLWYFSKLLFSLFSILRIFIRMPFDSKFSVCFFNLFIVCILFNTKDLIETSF